MNHIGHHAPNHEPVGFIYPDRREIVDKKWEYTLSCFSEKLLLFDTESAYKKCLREE